MKKVSNKRLVSLVRVFYDILSYYIHTVFIIAFYIHDREASMHIVTTWILDVLNLSCTLYTQCLTRTLQASSDCKSPSDGVVRRIG